MTWTPEETAYRLAERDRYRAEHPEFDDWFLRACAREARREANRAAWREGRRPQSWDAGMTPRQRLNTRLSWNMGTGGRPKRRARIESLRQALIACDHPAPEREAYSRVMMQEQYARDAYRLRRDEERAERGEDS
jgi:hypothetical protein